MTGPRDLSFFFPDPESLSRFAETLAPSLRAGDLVTLQGELGSGKTHFARAVVQARLRSAGRVEDVPSPTYTLVQTYWDGITEIWHSDLYRLADVDGLDELGLIEALESSIVLVEWPELLLDQHITPTLRIALSPGPDGEGRTLVATAQREELGAVLNRVMRNV